MQGPHAPHSPESASAGVPESARGPDLAEDVPDECGAALILIDVINDLEFPGGAELLPHALAAAEHISALKARSRAAGVPCVYVNDNFGRWRSDLRALVERCSRAGVRGRPLVELLRPDDEDYFVLKPLHSAFYATSLEVLLHHLGARTLVLTGFATDICVLYSANDAYMRNYRLVVPPDCTAAESTERSARALDTMGTLLKAVVRPSPELDLSALAARHGSPVDRPR